MANSNGNITAPVSFNDVNTVFGTQITTLSGLCISNNINIMSKYKPVPYSANTMLQWDSTNNKWSSSATWFKGNGNDYGLAMFNTITWSDIVNRTSGGTNSWSLSHPSGGSSEPYRLHDFASYSHNDGKYYITSPSSVLTTASATISLNGQGSNGLSMNTLLPARYFGAAFINPNNATCLRIKTSTSTDSTSVTFNSVYFGSTGNFRIVPFYSSKTITEGGSSNIPSGTIFYTIPYASINNITITESNFKLNVQGTYTNSGTLYVTGLTIRYKVNGAGVVKTDTFLMEDCVEIPQGHTKTFGTFEFPTTSIGANDTMTITYITLQASNNNCDAAQTCDYQVVSGNISPNSNISSNTDISLTLSTVSLC